MEARSSHVPRHLTLSTMKEVDGLALGSTLGQRRPEDGSATPTYELDALLRACRIIRHMVIQLSFSQASAYALRRDHHTCEHMPLTHSQPALWRTRSLTHASHSTRQSLLSVLTLR